MQHHLMSRYPLLAFRQQSNFSVSLATEHQRSYVEAGESSSSKNISNMISIKHINMVFVEPCIFFLMSSFIYVIEELEQGLYCLIQNGAMGN